LPTAASGKPAGLSYLVFLEGIPGQQESVATCVEISFGPANWGWLSASLTIKYYSFFNLSQRSVADPSLSEDYVKMGAHFDHSKTGTATPLLLTSKKASGAFLASVVWHAGVI